VYSALANRPRVRPSPSHGWACPFRCGKAIQRCAWRVLEWRRNRLGRPVQFRFRESCARLFWYPIGFFYSFLDWLKMPSDNGRGTWTPWSISIDKPCLIGRPSCNQWRVPQIPPGEAPRALRLFIVSTSQESPYCVPRWEHHASPPGTPLWQARQRSSPVGDCFSGANDCKGLLHRHRECWLWATRME